MPVYPARQSMLESLVGSFKPEDESVFDSPTKRLVRGAARLLGVDSLEGEMTQMVAPSPLVSIYADKLARKAATQSFLNSAKAPALPKEVSQAANWLAERYPRVAAHMRINPLIDASEDAGAFINTPAGKVTSPMQVTITDKGVNQLKWNSGSIRDSLAHEATHAAQALGNSDNDELYELANQAVGYTTNPFEVTARNRGTAAAMRSPHVGSYRSSIAKPGTMTQEYAHPLNRPREPYTANRGLRRIVETNGLGNESFGNSIDSSIVERIKEILDRRGVK